MNLRLCGMSRLGRRVVGCTVVAVALVGAWGSPAQAQVLYGSIVGNVRTLATPRCQAPPSRSPTRRAPAARDSDGRHGALHVLHRGYGHIRRPRGTHRISDLRTSGVPVTLNSVARVDVTLGVGSITETVTVSADIPLLQSDRAEGTVQIATKKLQNLPVPSAAITSSCSSTCQASRRRKMRTRCKNPSRAMSFNVNGASFSANNTRIDGTRYAERPISARGGLRARPRVARDGKRRDQQFRRRAGLAGGSAINVQIKSGTNEFPSLGVRVSPQRASARRAGTSRRRGPTRVTLEISLAARSADPLLRNKLFFFSSYEKTFTDRQLDTIASVPTAALRRGDLSASPTLIYDPLTGASNGSGAHRFKINRSRLDGSTPFPSGSSIASPPEPAATRRDDARDQQLLRAGPVPI